MMFGNLPLIWDNTYFLTDYFTSFCMILTFLKISIKYLSILSLLVLFIFQEDVLIKHSDIVNVQSQQFIYYFLKMFSIYSSRY